MRRGIAAVLAVAAIATACSPEYREVETNSGGFLDCPSDTGWYAAVSPNPGMSGGSSPTDALAEPDSELSPPGEPQVESGTATRVVFLYIDADGHRTGRVTVEQISGTGWYLTFVERCG